MLDLLPGNFHFIRPYFLGLIGLVFIFMWLLYKKTRNNNVFSKLIEPEMISYLMVGTEKKSSNFYLLLILISGILLTLAMAGPTWSKLPQAVYKEESARVFVLDLSQSMNATDITPSRASRAKLKLIDFLTATEEGQAALIVFADRPHIVSPLTDDAHTISNMVPSLGTEIMPTSGSRVDLAIMKAAQLLKQAGNVGGDIVLLTDGVNFEKSLIAAEKISATGFHLRIIGVGTDQGAPIPISKGGFLKDTAGNIVIPKLNRSKLKELALAGSGQYVDISINDNDISFIEKSEIEQQLDKTNPFVREVDLWKDQGHWFLLLALPFAIFGFRRGWLTSIALVFFITPQQEVYAFEWADLWQNNNQRALEKLHQGDVDAASKLFDNPEWKASAQYKAGDYQAAEESFANTHTAKSKYNLANTLARQGKLQEALDAYDESLNLNPENQDALFNKELVKKILDKEQSEQESDQSNDSDENKDSEENEKDDSEQSSDENSEDQQNSSDQKSSDEENDKQEQQQSSEKDGEKSQSEIDEQKKAEEEAKKKAEEAKQEKDDKQDSQNNIDKKEIQQATEQWLRRIPDDPGGLIREKLRRQYQRDRLRQRSSSEKPW